MKAVQRMGGKMMKRSEDQQDVGAVIAEFKSVENMLDRLMRDLKTWRDSWDDVLKLQYDASEAFAFLYKPLEPPAEPDDQHQPKETPQLFMQKCLALQKMYSEQRADLQQEIGLINTKIIRPVEQAKQAFRGLQKTLKHRENTKLDYERYLSRAEHARKKDIKSVKDEQSLTKAEGDLTQAKIDYQTADEQVISTFPPVSHAVASLMPYVLASQVMLQTTLVGQLYTSLDAYCRQQKMPSPAPSDSEIIGRWESEFTSFRKELESGLTLISSGRAVNQSMNVPEKDTSSFTGLGIRNKARSGAEAGRGYLQKGKSGQSAPQQSSVSNGRQDSADPDVEEEAPPKPPRPGTSSASPMSSPYPPVSLANKPRIPSSNNVNAYAAAYDQKPPPPYQESAYGGASPSASSHYATPKGGHSPAASTQSSDYFGASRPTNSLASSAAAAAKKKPPPPVPVKRIASAQSQFVTALYDFAGQNDGDLSFQEGDRIAVIRKTESTDDWWEGSIGGRKGSFPANYVQL